MTGSWAGNNLFEGRLALQQRVLPAYRVPFLDALAQACSRGLNVFAGEPRRVESIETGRPMVAHFTPAHNLHLFGGPLYLCWQPGIIRWLEGCAPEGLVVEANPRYLSTPAAVRWMHTRKLPVIGWGLGAPPLAGPLAALRKASRRRFISAFDVIIAYSKRGAEQYCQLGVVPERVFVARNAAAPRPIGLLPERPPVYAGKPTVLFVGRLQERKRVDLLLRACAALPEDLQPRLAIVGDGPARDDLVRLAYEIYPTAEFPGGRYGTDLEGYFRSADLFVLPGTGGLAIQQAMSYGLPVVVAEGDGTQDDLVRPGNGWRTPPASLDTLTQVLRQALSDPAVLRKMGSESYRIVDEEINLESMVSVFLEALDQARRLPQGG